MHATTHALARTQFLELSAHFFLIDHFFSLSLLVNPPKILFAGRPLLLAAGWRDPIKNADDLIRSLSGNNISSSKVHFSLIP